MSAAALPGDTRDLLPRMLAAWQAEIDSVPIRVLITVEAAMAIVATARRWR